MRAKDTHLNDPRSCGTARRLQFAASQLCSILAQWQRCTQHSQQRSCSREHRCTTTARYPPPPLLLLASGTLTAHFDAISLYTHNKQVFFSKRYTYASILHKASPADGGHYIASASTLQRDVRDLLRDSNASHCDVRASVLVGRLLAEKAKEARVDEIHFDNHRNLQYQGKLRALIESIRSNGVRVK